MAKIENFRLNIWSVFTITLALLITVPILFILLSLAEKSDKTWQHIVYTLLPRYLWHSSLLTSGVALLSVVGGLSTAWLVTAYEFPMRRYFEWLLALPLAVPTYIVAYIYAVMTGYTGVFSDICRYFGWANAFPLDIMNLGGAIFIISFVLYPYVYLINRSVFLLQSQSIIEVSRVLGKPMWYAFFKVALPLARPAIAASVFLITMDVLNEYGAVKYYGVTTFTTGIFKAWFSMGNVHAAIKLSAVLLIIVVLLVWFERKVRAGQKYASNQPSYKVLQRKKLSHLPGVLAFFVCLIPTLLGFFIPVGQLLVWTLGSYQEVVHNDFWHWVLNSLWLAVVAAFVTVSIAIIISYTLRLHTHPFINVLANIANMGYTVPGAVIAIGVMVSFLGFDKSLKSLFNHLGWQMGLLLSGTAISLIFAYLVRFLAVAYHPITSGFEKSAKSVDEASQSLGASSIKTLFRITLPTLKWPIATAYILVFVETLKELPLSIILRPFNFDTLAIKAYELANEELIQLAAVPSLIIVLFSAISVLFAIELLEN